MMRHLKKLLLSALLLTAPGVHAAQRLIVGMQLEPPILDPTANPAAAIRSILSGCVSTLQRT